MQKQYSLDDVKQMSYEQVGAINDPTQLMSTGSSSPMIIRYIIRTGQLLERFPDVDIKTLLTALGFAAAKLDWTPSLSEKIVSDNRELDMDNYLDNLQPYALDAIDIVTKKRDRGLSDSEIGNDLALLLMKEIIESRK